MKTTMIVLAALLCMTLLGCGAETESEPAAEQSEVTTETTAETEDRYELRGVIVERDPMANTLKVDHEAIGDWMGAMTMSFPVREADVQSLPADGETVTGTVHVDGTDFWLTDVVVATPDAEPSMEPAEDAAGTDTQE